MQGESPAFTRAARLLTEDPEVLAASEAGPFALIGTVLRKLEEAGILVEPSGYQWSTRDPAGIGWLALDEERARDRRANYPGQVSLHRRRVAYGDWEEVQS